MKAEAFTAVFILIVFAIVLIFSDFRHSEDLVLDLIIFILVAGALGFSLWLRGRMLR